MSYLECVPWSYSIQLDSLIMYDTGYHDYINKTHSYFILTLNSLINLFFEVMTQNAFHIWYILLVMYQKTFV